MAAPLDPESQKTERSIEDRAPDSPLEVPASGWKAILRRTLEETKDDRISITGAGVAFYWSLSTFPAGLTMRRARARHEKGWR